MTPDPQRERAIRERALAWIDEAVFSPAEIADSEAISRRIRNLRDQMMGVAFCAGRRAADAELDALREENESLAYQLNEARQFILTATPDEIERWRYECCDIPRHDPNAQEPEP